MIPMLPKMKKPDCLMQPGCLFFIKIRGFPSPPHGRSGFRVYKEKFRKGRNTETGFFCQEENALRAAVPGAGFRCSHNDTGQFHPQSFFHSSAGDLMNGSA